MIQTLSCNFCYIDIKTDYSVDISDLKELLILYIYKHIHLGKDFILGFYYNILFF